MKFSNLGFVLGSLIATEAVSAGFLGILTKQIESATDIIKDVADVTKALTTTIDQLTPNSKKLSGIVTPLINNMWVSLDSQSSEQSYTSAKFEDVVKSLSNGLSGLKLSDVCSESFKSYMDTDDYKNARTCIDSFSSSSFNVTDTCDESKCFDIVVPTKIINDCSSAEDDKNAVEIIKLLIGDLDYTQSFQCSKYFDGEYCGSYMMRYNKQETLVEGEQTAYAKAACSCYSYINKLEGNESYNREIVKLSNGIINNKKDLICNGQFPANDDVTAAVKPKEKNIIEKAKDGVTGIFSSDSTTVTVSKITVAIFAMVLSFLY
ncbi:hypothetical protein BCR36DRAFT_581167 [Piromyces finnis]|uniref:Uncharacterized protein n=1 Tax=Piromyces finnis TaxID=1754191 RepID=A0A1Y1VGY9_9FUNG|nr:hypothetical protein BCR36DRAFT_581167 [Piromyces finnis]|eukprot:ORX55997.1 hypothetical protein BCR36DRAFT_581167 [Piromyces finnis]